MRSIEVFCVLTTPVKFKSSQFGGRPLRCPAAPGQVQMCRWCRQTVLQTEHTDPSQGKDKTQEAHSLLFLYLSYV